MFCLGHNGHWVQVYEVLHRNTVGRLGDAKRFFLPMIFLAHVIYSISDLYMMYVEKAKMQDM